MSERSLEDLLNPVVWHIYSKEDTPEVHKTGTTYHIRCELDFADISHLLAAIYSETPTPVVIKP